jgi:RNA polymerase sigma-70 factor (ECF subfamily)
MYIKKGDQQALEELFEKYYYQLCDFAFQYVRSVNLTEEVVSDIFLKIWKKREDLTISGNFKGYLFTAVRNQSLNYIKKEQRPLDSLDDRPRPPASTDYQPDEKLLFKELTNRIETLINSLPPRRRRIFKLSRLEGFTYREIADMLSISIHTVQNQMVQAVKQLGLPELLDE